MLTRLENSKTKSGKVVTTWSITCKSCGKSRVVKRKDHAKSHLNKPCKHCSNKNNHPQGEIYGIRISFFNKYKLSAISRNIEWGIDIKYASEIALKQDYKCILTGIPLNFSGDFKNITASLDRIDNSLGYIKGNIQWVHKDINMMKGKLSMERFLKLCNLVADKTKW